MNALQGIGAVALGLILAASSASASVAVGAPAEEAQTHCAVQVQPIGVTDIADSAVCFDTRIEVEQYLGGTLASEAARGALAETILGTAYKNTDGGGSSFTFWGSSGCAGVVFGFSSLPSEWDNTIGSAGGSNGCWVTLYSLTSYGGSRLNCTPWCSSVYGLNDDVSSLVFRPTGTFG